MFPLPARARISCPVCGVETGDVICPNSQSMLREHHTYNDRFTSKLFNPYWDSTKQGFRLGWDRSDLETIYKDASSLVNTSVSLVDRPVPATRSMTEFYLSPNTLHGLTREEVFTLCLLGAYRSVEFPRTSSAVDKGYKMFQGYKIPQGMQGRVFTVLGGLRNLYSIILREPGPKLKPFRVGLMRLLFKWLLGPDMNEFLTYTDPDVDHAAMSRALSIPPSFKKYNSISFPGLATRSDKSRRESYSQAKDRYGPGPVLSQLYYHELPNAGDARLRQRVFDDLLWCMAEFDAVDVFGFPAFVFLPEDRLTRMLFLFSLGCLRAMTGERAGFDLVMNHYYLMSTLSPHIKLTPDLWRANALPFHADVLGNALVHQGYMSALRRVPNWDMSESEVRELFMRVCGYTPPDVSSFVSVVDNKPIQPDELRSLQAGNTADGSTVEMLNFKKALSILGPYINDPSPLPFQALPRYGILLCDGCKQPTIIDSHDNDTNPFITGCFEAIDPQSGMPPSRPVQDIVLEYRCPRCDRIGCRQLQVRFELTCKKCHAQASITGYKFGASAVGYTTHCPVCDTDSTGREPYDTAESDMAFDRVTFTTPPRRGEHGENILVLHRVHDDTKVVYFLEHPYNLLSSVPVKPMPDGHVPCPYEAQEKSGNKGKNKNASPCCQGVPSEWDVSRPDPPPAYTVHTEPGQHRTRLVNELAFDDGTVRKRYECEDHKEMVKAIVSNMHSDPKSNMKSYIRGDAKVGKVYLKNRLVPINSNKARLHRNRYNTTKQLMDIPLSLTSVPTIAGPGADDIITSTRYPRSIEHPDTPVHEVSKKDYDPAKPTEHARCVLEDDNKLAIELRHFYTFDVTTPAEPEPVIDCDQLCRDWYELGLIRDTMALDRDQRTYRKRRSVKKIRQWQLGHSPAHIVVGKSMPFIPTVTPKERVKVEYSRDKELDFSGMVAVLVDISGSMNSDAQGKHGSAKFVCDYMLTQAECSRCGSGYRWDNGIGCYRDLRRIDVARRLLVSIINDAKQRKDKVAIYAFEDSGSVVCSPSRDYKELTDEALNSPKLAPTGGTDLPNAIPVMLGDIESGALPDMLVTIILTDGDVGKGRLAKAVLPLLKNYGPVYLYQIDIGTQVEESYIRTGLRKLGWDPARNKGDHSFTWEFVDLSDGGKELFKKATKNAKKHLKR